MTLQQIKYILGVADSGSLNKASEKLFVSQPSLSSSIHACEHELGFTLFTRTARGVTATERGEEFINDARKFYAIYNELIKKYSNSNKKTFSVSTLYYSFARKAFIEIVRDFSSKGYDFSFCEKKASLVISDITLGKSALGILYLSDSNREEILKSLNANGLDFHHLTECNAFVYMHRNHPLAKKESLSLDELAKYRFVTFDTDDIKSFFPENVITRYELDKPITVADRATELNLMEQLNGYTFLSGISGEDANASGDNFVLIPLKNIDDSINHSFELGYITKIGTQMDNISLAYIDAIRRILHIAGFSC